MINENNLVWMDLEMTGLDPKENKIIEVAVIITDSNLNVIAESDVYAIHQPKDELDKMDEWNVNTHTSSGLIERVKNSVYTEKMCETEILSFISQFVLPQKSPLCGNSIWQDRRFLIEYMPDLEKYFHYRNIDVSTIKELARLWNPAIRYQKKQLHQALSDIRESIEELQYYQKNFFINLTNIQA